MARIAEPNPWAFCPNELAAQEDPPTCAFCEACEVSNEGDYCSEECEDAAKIDKLNDDALNALREVSP